MPELDMTEHDWNNMDMCLKIKEKAKEVAEIAKEVADDAPDLYWKDAWMQLSFAADRVHAMIMRCCIESDCAYGNYDKRKNHEEVG